MTYGNGRWLHHYLTLKNTETEIIRGDQRMAIEELYALLLHTSATHAGFEFSILPWSTRDFGMNLSPHGWFSAKFRAAVRNMLVREQGRRLHIFSCLSPAWVGESSTIAVRRAPTEFGMVNAVMTCRAEEASVDIDADFRDLPEAIVLHLPWFMDVAEVRADGEVVRVEEGRAVLPAATRGVLVRWTRREGAPQLSYERTVQEYKAEYRRRYERFHRDGRMN